MGKRNLLIISNKETVTAKYYAELIHGLNSKIDEMVFFAADYQPTVSMKRFMN